MFIIKTEGKMTAENFINMGEGIINHPEWCVNGDVVFDHRELDFKDVALEELNKIRDFHVVNESRIGKGKSAIVVASGKIDDWNELWAQGEKIETGNNVKIFDDYDEAVFWTQDN